MKEKEIITKEDVGRLDVTQVFAVGTSSAVQSHDTALAKRIETAMTKAVFDALAEGIPMTDSETILARKQAARLAVLAER